MAITNYQEHSWPKLMVLLLAGASCLVTGVLLKKRRLRDAQKEQAYIDSLSPRFEMVKQLAFSGPRSLDVHTAPILVDRLFCCGAALWH